MNTPTEYFGPHAKRWTDPDTGVTLSLSPRDYYRAVAKQQLREEKEVEDRLREAESAAWDDKALDLNATTFDTMHAEKTTADNLITSNWLKITEEEGVLISPLSGWNRYDAIVHGATRGGIKYPSSIPDGDGYRKTTDAEARILNEVPPMPPGTLRFLSLSEDDTFGLIRPVEQTAPRKPAARHFRRRPSARNIVRLGLVYIIAVIGASAVIIEAF